MCSQCQKCKIEDYSGYLVKSVNPGVRDYLKLKDYFEHRVPGVSSAQSPQQMPTNHEIKAFSAMIKANKVEIAHNFLLKPNSLSFQNLGLLGTSICIKHPKLICKKDKIDESELSSLLRHIRNGFAHGRIYIKPTSNQIYIVIEDFDPKKKKITAKLVLTIAILRKWKKIIEDEMDLLGNTVI